MILDGIAGGAGDLRNDRPFLADERIEQRRLSCVGRPDDRHRQALSYETAHLPIAPERFEPLEEAGDDVLERISIWFGNLIGEVDRARELFERRGEPLSQLADHCGQAAPEIGKRSVRARARFRLDHVGDGRGFVKVYFSVEKGAASELAGLRQPRSAG